LSELLTLAKQADDAFLEDELDLEELGKDLSNKVDDVAEYLEICKERAGNMAARAAKFSAKSSAFVNKRTRLIEYIELNMQGTGTEKIPGNFYRFILKTSSSVEPRTEKVSARMALKFKSFVRTKIAFSWNKAELKKAINAKDPLAMEAAYIKESSYLDINLRSD
jgi:hypothetical protein